MQDIHAVGSGTAATGGGGGRLFAGGGATTADRRLRPNHNQNLQALKCPRCDSLNTKFCYYNNYNLSQPRHFCKSCRRYWTKGGVLRNVPVGGGCRKTKRSKPKSSVASEAVATSVSRERNSNSHSSSESSSLTVTTTAAKKTAAAGSSGEVASATVNSSNSSSTGLLNLSESRFLMPQMNASSNFEQQQPLIDHSASSNGQIFQEIGRFTNLMTSSNDPGLLGGFNMPDISTYRLQQNHKSCVVDDRSSNQMMGATRDDDELKMGQMSCGFIDQTAELDFGGMQQNRISNGGLAGLDWQMNGSGEGGGGGGDQGLFDFSGTVDQAYWSQNQWAENDQSLINFPPLV